MPCILYLFPYLCVANYQAAAQAKALAQTIPEFLAMQLLKNEVG